MFSLDRKCNRCYIYIICNIVDPKKAIAMKKLARKREGVFIGITFGEDRVFSTTQEALKALGQ